MIASARTKTTVAAYTLLAPFGVVFAVFLLYPLVQSVVLSGEQRFGPAHAKWVGLQNFVWLAKDPQFWTAVKNTLVYTLGSLCIQLPLALGLAMLLNSRLLRGRSLYRLVFFSPQLMGLVFAAILAALVFEKRAGLLSQVLFGVTGFAHDRLGLPVAVWDLDFPWLQSYVMPTLILISLWMYVGFNMVYFLAALQNIDASLVEAAAVDGAGPVARFWNVTVPGIRPVASIVVLLSIIGSFQLFGLPYILLNQTPGPNDAGLTVVMYLYIKGFAAGDLGYASAIGWVLVVVMAGLALVQMLLAGGGDR